MFTSFLALVLEKALDDRIAALGRVGSWPEIVANSDSLTETEIKQDRKRFVVFVVRSPQVGYGEMGYRRGLSTPEYLIRQPELTCPIFNPIITRLN